LYSFTVSFVFWQLGVIISKDKRRREILFFMVKMCVKL
jgi:hypothetical protein